MMNIRLLILSGIIAAGLPTFTSAATAVNEGYWVDSAGSIIKNGSGGCWHTIFWTPVMAVAGCDPVAKQEEKSEPKIFSTMPPPRKLFVPKPLLAQGKMRPQKITLSEEDLFSFNKSVLKPNGEAKLDNLVQDLNGAKYEVIYVVGYTDRIGSAKYNQRLSLHRADAVKKFLVNKGIPADRIKTEGKGKAQPITKSTDCRHMTKAKMIVCLQPDRRTEVTVNGTK